MIWEQMEMRNAGVVDLLDEMFGGAGEEEEEGSDGEIEEESDEDDEGEEGTEEEWERMMAARGGELDVDSEGDEEEDGDSEGEDLPFEESEPHFTALGGLPPSASMDVDAAAEEEEEDPQADSTKDLSISSFDAPSSRHAKRPTGPPSAVDDTFFSLFDFHQQVDEGEFEMAKALRGDVDEEDELAGDGEELDLFAPVDLGGEDEEGEELDQAGEWLYCTSFLSTTG